MYRQLDQKELEAIRGLSTCAISNAIELFNILPRNEGFMLPGIECRFPELGTMIGYAVTAVISTAHPGNKGVEITDFWNEILRIPEPRVVVIHDSDIQVVGSFWGDVRSNIHRRLGCVGAVTDGAVRDLDEVRRIGFHFFSMVLFDLSVQNAGYAILHHAFTEIQKVSQFFACQLQISEDLLFVCFTDAFNRLQFQNDLVFHDDICAETLIELNSAELYRDGNLSLNL